MMRAFLSPILTGLLLAASASTHDGDVEARQVVRRFVEAANAHDFARLEQLLTPDFARHSPSTPGVLIGSRVAMLRFVEANARTFPDERIAIERTTVEGDTVAFWGTYSATHAGPMGPVPATGKSVRVDVSGSFRIEGKRVAELWILWDNAVLLGQLGLWPRPEGAQDGAAAVRNKALARVWFEEVVNGRDLGAIDEHYAEDYVHHGPEGAEIRGREAARAVASSILASCADRVAVVEQQVAEGDLVVTRFVSRGTRRETFRDGDPAGGEWVTEGICISRIAGGEIAEDWEIVHHSGR